MQLMVERDIKKIPGIVYHEENGKVFQYISEKYEDFNEIEKMRESIFNKIIEAGYEPDLRWVTDSKLTQMEEKLRSLCRHAEKTAIAHGFVLNPYRDTIVLLTTNLRI